MSEETFMTTGPLHEAKSTLIEQVWALEIRRVDITIRPPGQPPETTTSYTVVHGRTFIPCCQADNLKAARRAAAELAGLEWPRLWPYYMPPDFETRLNEVLAGLQDVTFFTPKENKP